MNIPLHLDSTPLRADFWVDIFANDHPVAIEIGPGFGEFLEFIATRQPDWNFFAIEHLSSRTRVIQRRLDAGHINNARALCAQAEWVLAILPDDCVDRFHIQFPDPWWKRRHHRRRLMNPALVAQLRRTLRVGGTIEFLSDVDEYFQLSFKALTADPGLEHIGTPELPTTTSFSRKAAVRGWRVYASSHRKRAP